MESQKLLISELIIGEVESQNISSLHNTTLFKDTGWTTLNVNSMQGTLSLIMMVSQT